MREAAEDRRRFVAGVYRESGPRLYRYALMILADRGDAEDVLQHVFAAVLSKETALSVAEKDELALPAASVATPALMLATTVPVPVMPLTATL
jgi:DNA-directed RNA polymerase specialized sigma24 family protein